MSKLHYILQECCKICIQDPSPCRKVIYIAATCLQQQLDGDDYEVPNLNWDDLRELGVAPSKNFPVTALIPGLNEILMDNFRECDVQFDCTKDNLQTLLKACIIASCDEWELKWSKFLLFVLHYHGNDIEGNLDSIKQAFFAIHHGYHKVSFESIKEKHHFINALTLSPKIKWARESFKYYKYNCDALDAMLNETLHLWSTKKITDGMDHFLALKKLFCDKLIHNAGPVREALVILFTGKIDSCLQDTICDLKDWCAEITKAVDQCCFTKMSEAFCYPILRCNIGMLWSMIVKELDFKDCMCEIINLVHKHIKPNSDLVTKLLKQIGLEQDELECLPNQCELQACNAFTMVLNAIVILSKCNYCTLNLEKLIEECCKIFTKMGIKDKVDHLVCYYWPVAFMFEDCLIKRVFSHYIKLNQEGIENNMCKSDGFPCKKLHAMVESLCGCYFACKETHMEKSKKHNKHNNCKINKDAALCALMDQEYQVQSLCDPLYLAAHSIKRFRHLLCDPGNSDPAEMQRLFGSLTEALMLFESEAQCKTIDNKEVTCN